MTSERIEIDDELKTILDSKIQVLIEKISTKPELTFTHFIYDLKKDGGEYVTTTGIVKKVDLIDKFIYLADDTKIQINEIIDISGEIYEHWGSQIDRLSYDR